MTDTAAPATTNFSGLGLPDALLKALADVGYESPSPIQAATIPPLLHGRDVLGQAQTGTGKTAAFALPILARLDPARKAPQALVLAPTRELAIQVAEAFQSYAAHLPGFHVLPIYGGQSYGPQLSALRRGVHVVVGTPGRVIDHLDKGTLDLSQLTTLVLDEADEMLRMGFIDDVERVLKQTPETRQTALFSATMPAPIKRIAGTYLRDPAEVTIAAKTRTADNIRQRVWIVGGAHKLDALTRILETEPFDAMIVFARTKQATDELAERLQARGFSAAAINGDIVQAQRERTIQQLKDGKIDILVATDVAARGLDVDRISHVLNYDVPYDTESYVHRIGRTGRAGRSGEAILFIAPRERNLLRAIERATRQPIEPMGLPTVQAVNAARLAKFKQRIADALAGEGLEPFASLIEEVEREYDAEPRRIAAALAKLVQGAKPLLLEADEAPAARPPRTFADAPVTARGHREERRPRDDRPPREPKARVTRQPDAGFESFRIEVGYDHGVKPGNIVGAIANEAGLDAKNIGRIEIYEDYSIVDLPERMPAETFNHLKQVWVAGQQLRLTRDGEPPDTAGKKPPRRKPFFADRKPGGEGKPFRGKREFDGERPFKPGKPKPHRKGPRPG
jgi:ATP-dependent RNA helicase DeaD